jgi:uncharacterized protein (DUF58 family)
MTPEQVMQEVRRIEITTRHLVRDIVAGEYSSVFRGRGVEFAEVREYQPGDDVRTIDWNVTARLGSTYVKRYLEERELSVAFAVDFSGSKRFGSRGQTKGDLAVEVCAVLALAAARNNDRVGTLFFTDTVERIVPARKGRRHVLRILSEILSFQPAGSGTNLKGALEQLELILKRRSVLFVVSDFLAEGYHSALSRLARKHDVIAVQLVDPRERMLPDAGVLTLQDPESGAWRYVDTSSRAVRDRFHLRMSEFDEGLERSVREHGADLVRLETGKAYAEPLLAFFRRRERMLWR